MMCGGADDVLRRLAKTLGASRAWVLERSVLDALGVLPVDVLGGVPPRCLDVREAVASARSRGELLAVDLTAVCGVGCPAIRLGAHLVTLSAGDGLVLVASSADLPRQMLESLDAADMELDHGQCEALSARLDELLPRHRAASDAAQVVAAYLACHPLVREVAYPGLKADATHEIAARTLESGFGPRIGWRTVHSSEWMSLTLLATDDPREVIADLEGGVLHV